MTWYEMIWNEMTWHDMTWHDMKYELLMTENVMIMTWHDMSKWIGDNMKWNDNDMTWGNELVHQRQSGDRIVHAPLYRKTLQDLHWLPIKWRMNYKVATLTYKLLESGEPTYLRSRITSKIFRSALRSSADERQLEPNRVHPIRKLDHSPFVVPHRQYGTACHMTLELHRLSLSFEADSKRTISSLPFNILLWL